MNRNPRVVDHALGSNHPNKTVLLRSLRSNASCAFQTRNEQRRISRVRWVSLPWHSCRFGRAATDPLAHPTAWYCRNERVVSCKHEADVRYSETNDIYWKIGLIERSLGIVHGCDSEGTNQSVEKQEN